MVFVCHMILQDQVIKASNDFMVRSPSKYLTILPCLVAIGTVVAEYNSFSFSRDLAKPRD